jgi:predicted TIM-barrel fold metal-dependent hydrolase
MRRILDVNPHALVFGTDLPSTRAPRPFEDDDLIGLTDLLGPESSANVLWHNAVTLYRARR